jgi:selenide,water dikinase
MSGVNIGTLVEGVPVGVRNEGDRRNEVLIPLERLSPRCGCAAKLDGIQLAALVAGAMSAGPHGTFDQGPEDCAIVEIPESSIAFTVDFGPLVTSSACRSGRIATAHALSDVFAAGASPRAAVAMLVVQVSMPPKTAEGVLAGIAGQCAADGVELVGGHTTVGPEAMAGLAVIGSAGLTCLKKRGARPGDVLMISKPIGVGLALRAARVGLLDGDELEPVLALMEVSNREASRVAIAARVSAATDVTGFGLLGHLAEMLVPDGLGAAIRLDSIPVLTQVKELPEAFVHSKGIDDNLAYCRELVRLRLASVVERRHVGVLVDPQTSGGLLVAVEEPRAAWLAGHGFREIGIVTNREELEVQG